MDPQHLSDEHLSAVLDDPAQAAAESHLSSCVDCARRLSELRMVVDLLRGLPEVEPPRDFSIGPRVLEPPNLVRLRRAYTWARAAAGSLAAVFVLLVGGAFYLDATAPSTGGVLTPPAQPTLAAQQAAPPTSPPPAPAAARAAQPAVQSAPAGADAPGSNDLSIATTGARALPTLTPTPTLPPAPVAAIERQAPAGDPGAPLRLAASVVGVLAALCLLTTVAVRHRLRSRREGP